MDRRGDLAEEVSAHDVPTLIITSDPLEAQAAAERGVLTYQGKLDSEDLLLAMDSVGVKVAVAVSRFRELNTLVLERAAEAIGRANIYYLPRTGGDDENTEAANAAVIARRPFGRAATQTLIERRVADSWAVEAVRRLRRRPSGGVAPPAHRRRGRPGGAHGGTRPRPR